MTETTTQIQMIPLGNIQPSPRNRRVEHDGALDELAQSIRLKGVLQPILVRRLEAPAKGSPALELIAGERRWRASQLAQRETIPAIVREGISEAEAFELTLIENLQRQDLTPLEEAEGFQKLLQLPGASPAQVAAKIGRSVQYVYDRAKLLNLVKEAQELLRAGRITAGHAVLLARLDPEQQAEAMDEDTGGLWTYENLVLTETEEEKLDHAKEPFAGMKALSVRELQGWIDKHIRFDTEAPDPMLFPETEATLRSAQEESEKVVSITHDYHVDPMAKDGTRIYGPRSWKPADAKAGGKPCEHSVIGVVVIGPGRGESFRVCIAKKKCDCHWGKERKEAEKAAKARATSGASGADRYAEERAKEDARRKKEEALRARFAKAVPAILKATAEKVKGANATAKGPLAALILEDISGYGRNAKRAADLVPSGKTPEDFVRHIAFIGLDGAARDNWRAHENFPKLAKALGVDVAKILNQVDPPKPAEAKPGAPKKAKKKAAA